MKQFFARNTYLYSTSGSRKLVGKDVGRALNMLQEETGNLDSEKELVRAILRCISCLPRSVAISRKSVGKKVVRARNVLREET